MRRVVLFSLCVLCVAGVAPVAAQARVPGALGELSAALEALARRVGPAVVQVFATAYRPAEGEVETGGALLATERTSGSGVILDPDGYVVTNAHVVEAAIRVQVELPLESGGRAADPAGRSVLKRRGRLLGAQVVAVDRETDLAILKIDARSLPALPLGDSEAIRPGQLVMAYGSPMGLNASVTLGVISAVARQLEPDDPMIYIQTDAPINPGNSGGPLVDMDGRVIGINTLIYSQGGGSEGIGFAAPSNIVRAVFEQVRKTGRVRRGEIGVKPQTITPLLASGLGLPRDWGVVLGDVDPDGAGARAGLEVGDLVLALDGKEMENGRQLQVNLYIKRIGEQVALEVLRGDRRLTYKVRVTERPDDPDRLAELVTPGEHLVPRLGVLGLNLDDRVATLLGDLRKPAGVVVAATSFDSPAAQQGGFLAGDVIYSVNRRPVSSLADLRREVAALKSGDAVVLQVERNGELRYVAFTID